MDIYLLLVQLHVLHFGFFISAGRLCCSAGGTANFLLLPLAGFSGNIERDLQNSWQLVVSA